MNILKKTLLVIWVGLVLTGCATSQVNNKHTEISSKIIYAPAIDISYSEVSANVEQNIGTDVRWGGQVIDSEVVNNSTVRLTVFAYPLSNEGRPVKTSQIAKQGGRFIVDLTDGFAHQIDFNEHLITFYGGVVSSLIVTNGNRQKTIPIINAEELVDWNMVDENSSYANDDRRGNAFYSLAYRHGHLGYGHSRYGYGGKYYNSGRRYSPYGNFSRGSYYNRGYFGRSGFGYSRSRLGRY